MLISNAGGGDGHSFAIIKARIATHSDAAIQRFLTSSRNRWRHRTTLLHSQLTRRVARFVAESELMLEAGYAALSKEHDV
jgi:hypothetical protein